MNYKVYVLYSHQCGRLLTGRTTSLTEKMTIHNSENGDEKTVSCRPWTLVHMELFNNEDDALFRETYLNSEGGNQYVRENILPLFEF